MGKLARILVVDDDEDIRTTIEAILENEGYQVDLATDGKEAINKTRKTLYNIVLIDIRLPDMNGTELLMKMKDTVPKTRKIIVTGYPSLQNAIEAVNKQADVYIIKPVDVKKLLSTIQEQLKLQENEKQFTELRVAEFIEARVKEIDNSRS
jgi:DNA-binding NtrC family response regulator